MAIGPIRRIFAEKFSKQAIFKKIWVIALLVVPGLSFWVLWQPSQIPKLSGESQNVSPARPGDDWTEALPLLNTASSDRTFYPYSVIPGGVRSREELQLAIARDPLAAAHYAGFRVASARVLRLAATRHVYVSYRMGEHIYWTRRRVTLPKGEVVIGDGLHLARARCGNRIAETPGPNSPAEPPAEEFERPARPSLPQWATVDMPGGRLVPFDPGVVQLAWNSAAPPNSYPYLPLVPPILCCAGGGTGGSKSPPPPSQPPPPPVPPTPPVVTPEPSSIALLLAGAFTLLGFWVSRRS